MVNPLKTIVVGSVNGHFAAAFKKLAALHAKNQFACCIATGNLFAEDEDDELDQLLRGQIEVPVTTYFTVGTRPFPARVTARLAEEAAHDSDELCPNLHYLGRRSVTKTAEGLRIVALGGALAGADSAAGDDDGNGNGDDICSPLHTAADESALRGAHGADILLTAIWPHSVWRGSQAALPKEAGDEGGSDPAARIPASDGLAALVAALRPRYHLTAGDLLGSGSQEPASFYYEREPFFHPPRDPQAAVAAAADAAAALDVTRFLALASWGNAAKAKALYAFALQPGGAGAMAPAGLPAGCTQSPFFSPAAAAATKRRAPLEPEPFGRFASHGADDHHRYRDGRGPGRHGKRRRGGSPARPPPGPDQCFFCLSNPSLPTHMIASVGSDAYLATAKGPLPEPSTFAAEGLAGTPEGSNAPSAFPGHMLIVPLSHAPTLAAVDGVAAAAAAGGAASSPARQTLREMTRFRASLQAMVAATSRQRLGTVTWEISRQRNVHVHWQTVPVPAQLVAGGLVEAAFRVEAANLQLPPLEEVAAADDDPDQAVLDADDYFRVWIWAETPDQEDAATDAAKDAGSAADKGSGRIVGKTLRMRLDPDARFDLQFGRRVVAKLLGLEATRLRWQDCVQTEAEETADVAAFRAAFAPWDFTLE